VAYGKPVFRAAVALDAVVVAVPMSFQFANGGMEEPLPVPDNQLASAVTLEPSSEVRRIGNERAWGRTAAGGGVERYSVVSTLEDLRLAAPSYDSPSVGDMRVVLTSTDAVNKGSDHIAAVGTEAEVGVAASGGRRAWIAGERRVWSSEGFLNSRGLAKLLWLFFNSWA
jgi:hypothetical protein